MTVTMIVIIVAGVVLIAFGALCILAIARAQKETRTFSERMQAMEKDLGHIGKLVREAATKPPQIVTQQETVRQEPAPQQELAKAPPQQAAKQVQQTEAVKQETAASPQKAAPERAVKPQKAAEPELKTDTERIIEYKADLEEINIDDLLNDYEDVLPEIPETPETDPAPTKKLTDEEKALLQIQTLAQAQAVMQSEKAAFNEPLFEPGKADDNLPDAIANETPQVQHYDYDIGQSGKRYTASELETLIRE